ncbi:type II toxin-antitoxin system PemK/MazF family toxin [Patulibacter sp. NPDC049589]|uniref:type II toxin-antitoxin system PemK/MazF family toxin n=1 Tax=Patulibacter sp. NPDC049589 TaxID=3154731 RepID=UPI00343400B2
MHPRQGELWWVDLDPLRGGEMRKRRPVLVLSHDGLNRTAPPGIVLAAPLTTTPGRRLHVPIELPGQEPPVRVSHIAPEHVRSLAHERLVKRIGRCPEGVRHEVARRVAILMRAG